MRPRRIALVSSSFHPRTGGVEEHTRHVARELAGRGHRVEVWTVDRGEQLGTRLVDGVTVRYLPCPLPARSPGAALRFLGGAPRAWRAWLRARRALRPDVLHVQCFGPNGLYALALHRLTGIPLVVSSHGETFMDDHDVFARSRLLSAGLRAALSAAQAVTACSRMVAEDLTARFGARRAVVVPNGVDPAEFATPAEGGGRTLAESAHRRPTVLALGRVEHRKGFDLLLDAFARADLPDGTRLVIAGDGGALAPLRAQAARLGISGSVDFPGRLSRPAVAEALTRATVLVVPSRVEPFGIVVLEGWRAGLPVIATRNGGPAEIMTDGVDGLLVDPQDTAALAAALADVLREPELAARLAAGGRERVDGYTWGRTTTAYEELYRTLPRRPAGPARGRSPHPLRRRQGTEAA
ncbi:glycosyltransferase family 4 protein [Georgenia daeguensis]|uniref:D-inositol 3-phosphate glycosyltransferase n=1 Tax=Georgenia daeguensis TaxID=908355 RepID=A0ABP8EU92_9MICO